MRVEKVSHIRNDSLQGRRCVEPNHVTGYSRPLCKSGKRDFVERATTLEARIGGGIHMHDDVGKYAADTKRKRFSFNSSHWRHAVTFRQYSVRVGHGTDEAIE